MALQKSLIPLPIDLGLNTKVDPKQEDIGFLRIAENVVYETLKLLRKRNGYDNVSLENLDGTNLEDIQILSKYKKELIAMTVGSLSTLSTSTGKWIEKGVLYPSEVKTKVILRNSSDQTNSSGYSIESFEIYAWEDSRGGIRYSVLDADNKSFLVTDVELTSSGTRPIICNIQNTVYVFYGSGTNLRYKTFEISNPETLSSAVTVKTDLNSTTGLMDAVNVENNIFIAYNSSTDEVSLFKINVSGVATSSLAFAGETASHALTIYADPQHRVFFSWSDGLNLSCAIYPSNLIAAILAPTVIVTEASNIVNVTIGQNENLEYTIFWEVEAEEAYNHKVRSANLELDGTVSGTADLIRSVGLASKAFSQDDVLFICVVHDSQLQPTNFIIDNNAKFVTKYNNQNSSGLVLNGVLNQVFALENSKFLIPSQTRGRSFSNDNAYYSLNGVSSTVLNFAPDKMFQNVFLADNLHICSGLLKMYDGKTVVEHGFNVFPEDLKQISPVLVTPTITVEGQIGVSEVQKIVFSPVPRSGTFSLTLGAETTSLLSWDASTATIESALEALTAVTSATVTGGTASSLNITFDTPKQDFALLGVSNNTLRSYAVTVTGATTTEGVIAVPEVQRLDFSSVPDSGDYTITIGAESTTALAFNASNATIKAALEAFTAITTVTVTGNYTDGIVITFDSPVQNFGPITVVDTLLTGATAVTVFPSVTTEGIAGVSEVQTMTFSEAPTAGTYTITINAETTASIAYNASNATIKTELEALASITTVTVTGSYASGVSITFDNPVGPIAQLTVSSLLTGAVGNASVATVTEITKGVTEIVEVQTLSFEAVPVSGSFTVTIGAETTTAINYTMGAVEVQSALNALTDIVSCTVTGSFTAGFTITMVDPVTGIPLFEITNNTLSSVVIANGEISDGDRAYVAVYRWTDNTGKDHFSAPTLNALTVIFNGDTETQSARIRVPTLRLTEKENVVIELYRTEDAGTTFYKVTSDLDPVFNDKTVDYIDIDDTTSDADLLSGELLYTTGNVVENIAMPACNLITAYQNRIAVVGEDENTVYFSKQVEEGKPVEPTDLITKYFEPIGGEISAIADMSSAFVAFQKDACHWISGQGPLSTLQQNDFTSPEAIAKDIGCIDSDSVVLTPNGLMFKSRKGIYLLSPNYKISYIGDKVELYNSSTITSAKVVGELNQIRFTTSEEIALVYNYNLDRWATFTNHGAKSAVVIENDYYYLREDSSIYKENRTSFSDASSPIKMRIQTGWLSFNQLQGFQRVYHALVLGTYKSAHQLIVKTAYNFIEAFQEQVTADVSEFIDSTPYGGYSPYGDPAATPYGGARNASLYQMRIDLEQQKCQSVKFQIEDAQDTIGEGLSLSSITLRVGGKQGAFPMSEDNKYGSE